MKISEVILSEIHSEMPDIITARDYINHAFDGPQQKADYFIFVKYLRNTQGAEYSTKIHKIATNLVKSGTLEISYAN